MIRLALTLLICLPAAAFAQLSDRLTIEMQPAFPEASTPVTLSVRSIFLDLDRATITWYVNGRQIDSGGGVRDARTELGPLGSKTTITVEVQGADGEFLTESRVVRAAEVDLIWEADSYVPPFYGGKRLASSGSRILVEALPRLQNEGKTVPIDDIIFTWRKNDAVVAGASGRGKSTAVFEGPELFGADTITVEVTSIDNTLIAASSILVPNTDPFVALYEDHPVFGTLFHRALSLSTTLSDIEASFVAVPFFASVTSPRDSRLKYSWRVNRSAIPTDTAEPSRITINADGSTGNARIELSVTHATEFTLDARGAWQLVFDSADTRAFTDLFGTPQ